MGRQKCKLESQMEKYGDMEERERERDVKGVKVLKCAN
jgi:hypothetical protein